MPSRCQRSSSGTSRSGTAEPSMTPISVFWPMTISPVGTRTMLPVAIIAAVPPRTAPRRPFTACTTCCVVPRAPIASIA